MHASVWARPSFRFLQEHPLYAGLSVATIPVDPIRTVPGVDPNLPLITSTTIIEHATFAGAGKCRVENMSHTLMGR